MTVIAMPLTGAPPASTPAWNSINWKKAVIHVRQLQMRIAKAYREGKHSKVKALQWILTHSLSAKLLAVKRVVQNDGAKSPGVDNIVWNTAEQKFKAALSLKRHSYQTKPLKRIYIPKKQKDKLRPLSIPVMECRAQQALHLLSLEPISETIADKNAYGFRPLRSTADAIEQCFKTLVKQGSAKYILEGDIKSCFDNISSEWLQENVIMDKKMLRKWLAAGYIEKGKLYSTDRGTPQGGVISPTLLNVTLSGLLANQIRGLLLEYGVIIPQGIRHIKHLPEILDNNKNKLTEKSLAAFIGLYEQFKKYDDQVNGYDKEIARQANQDVRCKEIQKIKGIGPITASAMVATIGDASVFKNGREVSAWLGLVPKQHSSGNKIRLGRISKRGDRYLRTLLIHGGRTVVNGCDKKTDKLNAWVANKKHRCGKNKAAVAVANKNARVIWAMLKTGEIYRNHDNAV